MGQEGDVEDGRKDGHRRLADGSAAVPPVRSSAMTVNPDPTTERTDIPISPSQRPYSLTPFRSLGSSGRVEGWKIQEEEERRREQEEALEIGIFALCIGVGPPGGSIVFC